MKSAYKYLILALIVTFGCGKATDQTVDNNPEDEVEEGPNQALYDQVMNVHDEVMPKMEDIYKLKSQLQEQIANTPDMVIEKKEQLEKMIQQLDSANNLMMDWMHQFNPLPDSVDQEQGRAYLESQLEKIKQVKEGMLSAIEKATEESGKN